MINCKKECTAFSCRISFAAGFDTRIAAAQIFSKRRWFCGPLVAKYRVNSRSAPKSEDAVHKRLWEAASYRKAKLSILPSLF